MSKRSVDRYIALYQSTGTVDPSKQCHGPPRVLNEFEQISLLQSPVNKPTMYLLVEKLQSELYDMMYDLQVHGYMSLPFVVLYNILG